MLLLRAGHGVAGVLDQALGRFFHLFGIEDDAADNALEAGQHGVVFVGHRRQHAIRCGTAGQIAIQQRGADCLAQPHAGPHALSDRPKTEKDRADKPVNAAEGESQAAEGRATQP